MYKINRKSSFLHADTLGGGCIKQALTFDPRIEYQASAASRRDLRFEACMDTID